MADIRTARRRQWYNNIARSDRSRRAHSHAQSTGSRVAAAAVLLSPSSPTHLRRTPSSSLDPPRSKPDASGGDGGSDAFYKRQRLHAAAAAAATTRPESTWVCVPFPVLTPAGPSPEFLRYTLLLLLLLCRSFSVPTPHGLCDNIFFGPFVAAPPVINPPAKYTTKRVLRTDDRYLVARRFRGRPTLDGRRLGDCKILFWSEHKSVIC